MSQKAFRDPVELAEKVEAYFAKCEDSKDVRQLKSGDIRIRQEIPSFVGLAVFLGIAKSTLQLYDKGEYDLTAEQLQDIADKHGIGLEDIQNYSAILSRARDRFELAVLQAGSNGDCDSRVIQARLAGYGYSTKVEVDSKATLTVQWEGTSLDDVESWGK